MGMAGVEGENRLKVIDGSNYLGERPHHSLPADAGPAGCPSHVTDWTWYLAGSIVRNIGYSV